jgi:uncharacterized protein (TIGR02217 family)
MTGTFHEVLFPTDISYGSSGGPAFKTSIFTADSGYEQRNVDWQNIQSKYDVTQAIKTWDQMTALTEFFMARRGRAYGFRFLDYNDFNINAQQIGVGDGTTTVFQLIKTYTSYQAESDETDTYTRIITKPAWNTIAGVTVGGVTKNSPGDYTVDYTTGLFTFTTAPGVDAAIIVGAAQFHVPVRFDIDHFDVSQDFFEVATANSITLVEVRDWGQVFS